VADINIVREHHLGLERARRLARHWADEAATRLELECTYEEGETRDVVRFQRSGADGQLQVTKDRFELDARLGALLGVFKGKIEGEIVRNLDELLAREEAVPAPEPAKRAPRHAKPRGEPHKAAAKGASRKA
jgi:putative polyhydroxyalkanoate system protein